MTRQRFTKIIDGLLRPTKQPAYQTLAEAMTADIPKPAFRIGMYPHTIDALSAEALAARHLFLHENDMGGL